MKNKPIKETEEQKSEPRHKDDTVDIATKASPEVAKNN